jgi:hypothetical protein
MWRKIFLPVCALLIMGVLTASGVFAQGAYDWTQNKERQAGESQTFLFDKDVSYDVYYEVTAYEIHRIENVRIRDIVDINGEQFMVVEFSGMTSRVGYVHLKSVRAILPTGAPRPNRSAELKKY